MAEAFAFGIAAVACATDIRTARIPNLLTFTAIVAGVLFQTLMPQGSGVAAAALGMLAGLLVFFPIFALGAMGAGDVKLMAALGAWVGWHPSSTWRSTARWPAASWRLRRAVARLSRTGLENIGALVNVLVRSSAIKPFRS